MRIDFTLWALGLHFRLDTDPDLQQIDPEDGFVEEEADPENMLSWLAKEVEELREHVDQVDETGCENRRELVQTLRHYADSNHADVNRRLAGVDQLVQRLAVDLAEVRRVFARQLENASEALKPQVDPDPTASLIQRLKRRGGRG